VLITGTHTCLRSAGHGGNRPPSPPLVGICIILCPNHSRTTFRLGNSAKADWQMKCWKENWSQSFYFRTWSRSKGWLWPGMDTRCGSPGQSNRRSVRSLFWGESQTNGCCDSLWGDGRGLIYVWWRTEYLYRWIYRVSSRHFCGLARTDQVEYCCPSQVLQSLVDDGMEAILQRPNWAKKNINRGVSTYT